MIGAAGRLGACVAETFADRDVVAHTRASLDITDPAAVRHAVERARPDVILNCAAFNRVDEAETRPVDAFAVNAFAVRSLARAAESAGAMLVHYGSDFVFDGSATEPYAETAQPSPRSTYALSKLLGEWFALDAPRALVLRVESLFGSTRAWPGRGGSVDTILDALEQGRVARAFMDRVVSPSYVEDVARATKHLVESGAAPGLYHVVNSGCATWYELAEEAARVLGVPPRLEAVSVASVPQVAARPRFCALSNQKLAATGFPMPSWQDALGRWVAVRGRRAQQATIGRIHG